MIEKRVELRGAWTKARGEDRGFSEHPQDLALLDILPYVIFCVSDYNIEYLLTP